MTKIMKIGREWLVRLLPEGFPYPSSTLISGPGGSGKPLIGYIFASEWLRNGGGVAFMLTSTTKKYLENTMKILGVDLENYLRKVFFIELDPIIENVENIDQFHLKANFIKPNVWDKALKMAEENIKASTLGIMVVGSALNLLFFSGKYREQIHVKIKELLEKDKSKTFMFTLNSDVFRNLIEELERSSDNLMFSRMKETMRLYLRIERMKDVKFKNEETEVPLSKEILKSIKMEAEKGKKYLIPTIKRI